MSDLTSNRKIDSALNTSVVSKHKPLTYPKKVLIPQNTSLLNNDNIFKATKTVANKTSTQTDELVKKSTYQKIDEVVTGGLEAGATLITGSTTGLAGRVIGIAQGLSKSIISGEFGTNEGANIVEQEALKFQSAATYSPKTKKGQSYLNSTGEFLAPLQAIPIVSAEASVIGNSVRINSSAMVFNKVGALVSKGVKSETKLVEWTIPKSVSYKIPSEWGTGVPNRKGVGTRWKDPENKGNSVRIDKGNPNNSQPSQQADHVIINSNGKIIGRDGQPITGSIQDNYDLAHIPLTEYKNWKKWGSPL